MDGYCVIKIFRSEYDENKENRTAERMRRWLFFMVCLGLSVPAQIPAFAMDTKGQVIVWEDGEQGEAAAAAADSDPLKLYSQSAVLVDGLTGRVLYGKGQDTVRPMASTTKIMTCILALERGKPEDVVTASSLAAGQPKVHLGVKSGETFYLKDLLYSLMLESHNDSAVMIAEQLGGSVPEFAGLMNQKARDLGCMDTYFITPNGLDGREVDESGTEQIHSTTARDLARIMAYCVNQSPRRREFLEITGTRNYFFTDIEGKRSFNCTNHNAFLSMMDGVLSGKTGFTGGAGYSYVGALENGGRSYTIALLGCGWPPHKTWKWSDARKLYQFGLEHYQLKDVFREQEFLPVPVTGGLCWGNGGETAAEQVQLTMNLPPREQEVKLLLGEGEQVEICQNLPKTLKAPVRAGTQVGAVDYRIDGQLLKRFPVYTAGSVERLTLKRCICRVLGLFGNLHKTPSGAAV